MIGWLLALGHRHTHLLDDRRRAFNLRQILLVAWTIAALAVLLASIHEGLLGTPDMQIRGNGSHGAMLRWFGDRVGEDGAPTTLPRAWVLSLSVWFYRGAMLAWALWIASALIGWLRWGWAGLSTGGLWRRDPPRPPLTP